LLLISTIDTIGVSTAQTKHNIYRLNTKAMLLILWSETESDAEFLTIYSNKTI